MLINGKRFVAIIHSGVSNNTVAVFGGGLYSHDCEILFTHCIVSNYSATNYGGAFHCGKDSIISSAYSNVMLNTSVSGDECQCATSIFSKLNQ